VVSLIPTVATYYIWFLLIQIAILLVKMLIDTILKFINEFPLFLLFNYLLNPTIFPYGIRYKIVKTQKKTSQPIKKNLSIQFLKLQVEKISINSVFAPFFF